MQQKQGKMYLCHLSQIALAFLLLPLMHVLTGCSGDSPPAHLNVNSPEYLNNPKEAMFLLASEEAAHYVLRNVDRPFDATLEKPVVYIQPDDNTIAHIAVYCTLKDAGQVVRRLFFVVLENTKSPESATKKEDFSCLLVNSDGKVLSRDNDYWNALPLDAQQKAGAIDTNGPPFIATSLLKLR